MAGTPDDTTRTPVAERPVPRQQRPRPGSGTRPAANRRRAPLPVAAAITTLWAALVSYGVVVGAVALASTVGGGTASARGVLRAGTAAWLLAHGVPLVTGGGRLGVVPLAVSGL